MTIEEKTAELKAWAAAAAGGHQVVTGPPAASSQDVRVSLHLLEIDPEPPQRGVGQHVLRATLRYLVTVSAPDPEAQQRVLGELVFAAMDSSLLEIEAAPQGAELWRAFGVSPQAAFVIRAKVWQEVPERIKPLVREAVFQLESRKVDPHGTGATRR